MPHAEKLAIFGRSARAFALVALVTASVSVSPGTAQERRFEVLPVGPLRICAAIDDTGKASLTARSANSCLSSSCRRFVRSILKANVKQGRIVLSGDLLHRKPIGMAICTRDCAGARTVPVAVEGLTSGRYTVVHNGKVYGAIDLARGGQPSCVGGK